MNADYFSCLLLGALGLQSIESFSILKFLDCSTLTHQFILWLRILAVLLALIFLNSPLSPVLFAILLAIELYFWKIQRGPLNGASSSFTVLALLCICMGLFFPHWADFFLSYLALQVILSYFVAGIVKIRNPGWRDGSYLKKFLTLTPYSPRVPRQISLQNKRFLAFASWGVLLFELTFPLAFVYREFGNSFLGIYLAMGFCFHLTNAFIFGLHRFFWIWISTYPLLWSFAHSLP